MYTIPGTFLIPLLLSDTVSFFSPFLKKLFKEFSIHTISSSSLPILHWTTSHQALSAIIPQTSLTSKSPVTSILLKFNTKSSFYLTYCICCNCSFSCLNPQFSISFKDIIFFWHLSRFSFLSP